MNRLPPGLARLLDVDPDDSGCESAMDLLHAYADLAAVDPTAAAVAHPAIAAHLAICGPCAEDLTGLLEALAQPDPG